MTDIEQKIRVIRDEARTETPFASEWAIQNLTLRRAIEQHEAFRQEVSDAVKAYAKLRGSELEFNQRLQRFIIAKPDPLVEVVGECDDGTWETKAEYAQRLRAAIEKRGGRIIFDGSGA